MKRYILLILLLAAALLIIGCGSHAKEEDEAELNNSVLATGAETSILDADALEYSNGQIVCRFRKDEDVWKWVDDPDFPLDATYVTEMLNTLDVLSSSLSPVTPAPESSDSGLDDPKRSLILTMGEETTTLRFGNQTDADDWYMSIDGQEDVYLAPDALMQLMDRSIYDMAQLPSLPELTEEDLTAIHAEETGTGRHIQLVRAEDGWTAEAGRLPEDMTTLADSLNALSIAQCFNFDPSAEAVTLCGLDTPTATLSFTYLNSVGTESTLLLTLGTLREDGFYFVLLNDDTTIYLMAQDALTPFLELLR